MAGAPGAPNPRLVWAILLLMALGLAAYTVAPPLYWHLAEALGRSSSSSSSCPPCSCDCLSRPLLSLPEALRNVSFTGWDDNGQKRLSCKLIHIEVYACYLHHLNIPRTRRLFCSDCSKRDQEVSKDMEKNFTDLLSEELKLKEAEAAESQRRADVTLLEAKKLASQYQKEADKVRLRHGYL